MTDDELPPDSDLDDLPAELREHSGPLHYSWLDPESGEVHQHRRITKTEVGAMLADERRAREADDGTDGAVVSIRR
jgi:hypothetical protein